MQQFIDKLISRLETMKVAGSGCGGVLCEKCKYDDRCLEGELSFKVALDNVILFVNQLAEEEKNTEVNVITSFLQYVRDNSDNPEYDNENGWSLADLIDLSIKFSEAKEHCDAVHDLEKDDNERG